MQETGDFMDAWGGISALQFGLPVMWTNLRTRGYDLHDLTRLMSAEPAKLAGIDNRKGRLAAGYDADLVIWQPEDQFTVVPGLIQHKHKLTPYSGMDLYGKISATYVRGRKAFEFEQFEIAGQLVTS
jgi:allantoinase